MQLFLFSRKAHLNSKILAAALILLLNLTPVAPVFAALPPQPTLANPDIFTDTAQPRINGSTGAFTQSYSLDIPPGRNGLQPDVTLDYSSQRTQDSIVGYGWQLSIPYIQRINKTGTQDLFGTTPFFTSSIDGELTNTNVTATTSNATTSPTILDALPLSTYKVTNSTSDSRSYTVPAGGINKLFVILLAENGSSVPSATLNGIPVAFSKIPGTSDRMGYFVGYVPSPSSGTFQITFTYSAYARYALMTLQNAAQSYPIDASAVTATTASTSLSTSITTSQGKDLLLSYPWWVNAGFVSFGPNESTLITPGLDVDAGNYAGSYKFASAAIGTETMTIKLDSIKDVDEPVVAIKAFTGGVPIAGNYIARVDNGTDNIYSFAGNTWTVYGKKGTRYLFGSSDAGRQYDTSTGTSTNTYKWYLQEIRDINGNYIKYTYNRDSNELYPNQIIYTGNSASDGPAVISFATSTRPDVRISFAPSFKVTTNYRVSEVDASFNGALGGAYNSTGGASAVGQGSNGGGQDGSSYATGGGGGASAGGSDGATNGGKGGDGITSTITGSSVYYAGGGGGGVNGSGGSPGAGGQGGGASGGTTGNAGGNATANTGGGGGGGSLSGSTQWTYHAGGTGGSGIVIITYPTGTLTATGGTVTTANGYTIHTFTSSGTWTVTGISTASGTGTTTDTRLYYDNLAFGQVGAGNNTRQEDWISGNTFASSTKTYNSYGLVATSTDRRGYATGYKYDAFNLYVATATNPLGQQTQYLYNYANGKVKQTTDPNSRIAKSLYDGVGRLFETDQSDIATPSLLATSTTYQFTDNATAPSIIHRADYLTATNTVDTYDYYDGFNRLVQERKASQTAGTYAATDRLYNAVGLLASTSLPYFSSGSGFTSPTSINALYTSYTYDPLKRVLTTANAVGQAKNTYAKWTTTTTDPNGNIKDYTLDAYGNLASVVEHVGSTLATTTYAYDASNNLATTTDSNGNVRAFTYDGINRRLTAQDLHAATHTPFGVWSYSYDDAGNMISQVDPKGSTTTRTYDALGRLLMESNAGATQVTNTYDSCTYGVGYLCVASSTAVKAQNAYDILGRVTYATTTIAGIGYTMGYTYGLQGNITTLTYPNGSQVSYTYNLAGQVARVQNKVAGGSWADIASSLFYAPHGVVTNTQFGNGASSTWTFDPNALYRLAALQTQGQGATTIQNFSYTYDPVGNITQIANTASTTNNGTVSYSYDALNRLTYASSSASNATPYAQAFS